MASEGVAVGRWVWVPGSACELVGLRTERPFVPGIVRQLRRGTADSHGARPRDAASAGGAGSKSTDSGSRGIVLVDVKRKHASRPEIGRDEEACALSAAVAHSRSRQAPAGREEEVIQVAVDEDRVQVLNETVAAAETADLASIAHRVGAAEVARILRTRAESGRYATAVGMGRSAAALLTVDLGIYKPDDLDESQAETVYDELHHSSAESGDARLSGLEFNASVGAATVLEAAIRDSEDPLMVGAGSEPQLLVVAGDAESQKRHTFWQLQRYAAWRGRVPDPRNLEKLEAASQLVEAFTSMPSDGQQVAALGCAMLLSLDIDKTSQSVVGFSLESHLFSALSLCRRPSGFGSFQVLYALLAGASEEERTRWKLRSVEEYRLLCNTNIAGEAALLRKRSSARLLIPADEVDSATNATAVVWPRSEHDGIPLRGTIAGQSAGEFGRKLVESPTYARVFRSIKDGLRTVGVEERQQSLVFQVLASILLLGNVDISDDSGVASLGGAGRRSDVPETVVDVAELLGIEADELVAGLLRSDESVRLSTVRAAEQRDGAVCVLYANLVRWLSSKLASKDGAGAHATKLSVLLLPSFQASQHATLPQCLLNYGLEKVAYGLAQATVSSDAALFKLQGLTVRRLAPSRHDTVIATIGLSKRGALQLLSDSCRATAATDSSFFQQLVLSNKRSRADVLSSESFSSTRKGRAHAFSIKHAAGSPVTYDVAGWLWLNRTPVPTSLLRVCSRSKLAFVRMLSDPGGAQHMAGNGPGGKPSTQFEHNRFDSSVDDVLDLVSTSSIRFLWCLRASQGVASKLVDEQVLHTQLCGMDVPAHVDRGLGGLVHHMTNGAFCDHFMLAVRADAGTASSRALKQRRTKAPSTISSAAAIHGLASHSTDASTMAKSLWAQLEIRTAVDHPMSRHILCGKTSVILSRWALEQLEAMRRRSMHDMDQSVVKVQSLFRGKRQRLAFRAQQDAAQAIQARIRGTIQYRLFKKNKAARNWLLTNVLTRRHNKLRAMTIHLQGGVRGFLEEASYIRRRVALRRVHFLAQGFLVRARLLRNMRAIQLMQSTIRDWLVRRRVYWTQVRAALLVQASYRGFRWRRQHARLVEVLARRVKAKRAVLHIIRFQAIYRGRRYRQAFLAVLYCVVRIQAAARAWAGRDLFKRQRRAAVLMQAAARRHHCRTRYAKTLERRHMEEAAWRLNVLREREALQIADASTLMLPFSQVRLERRRKRAQWRDKCRRRANAVSGHFDHKDDPSSEQSAIVLPESRLVDVDLAIDVADVYDDGWTSNLTRLQATLRAEGKSSTASHLSHAAQTSLADRDHDEDGAAIESFAVGRTHTVALDDRGRVWSYGWGERGQLGLVRAKELAGLTAGDSTGVVHPIEVSAKPKRVALRYPPSEFSHSIPARVVVTQLAAGEDHTLALTKISLVFSWGVGNRGQLGHGDFHDCAAPRVIDALRSRVVTSVSAGSVFSAAATDVGKLYTWGAGEFCAHPALKPGNKGYDRALEKLKASGDSMASLGTSLRRLAQTETEKPRYMRSTVAGEGSTVASFGGQVHRFHSGFRPLAALPSSPRVSASRTGGNVVADGVRVATPTWQPPPKKSRSTVSMASRRSKTSSSRHATQHSAGFLKGISALKRAIGEGRLRYRAPAVRPDKPPELFRDLAAPKAVQALNKVFVSAVSCGSRFMTASSATGHVWSWGHNDCGQLGVGHCMHQAMPVRTWPPSSASVEAATAKAQASMFDAALHALHERESIASGTSRDSLVKMLEYSGSDSTVTRHRQMGTPSKRKKWAVDKKSKADARQRAFENQLKAVVAKRSAAGGGGSVGRGGAGSTGSLSTIDTVSVTSHGDAGALLSQRALQRHLRANEKKAALEREKGGVQSMPTSTGSRALVSLDQNLDGILPDDEVMTVSAGAKHVSCRLRSGRVMGWGNNEYGQLGTCDTLIRVLPTQAKLEDQLQGHDDLVVSVSSGLRHTVVVTEWGRLLAWGRLGCVPPIPTVEKPAPAPAVCLPTADFAVPVEVPFRCSTRVATSVTCSWSQAISATFIKYKDIHNAGKTDFKYNGDLGADVRGRVVTGSTIVPGASLVPKAIAESEAKRLHEQKRKLEAKRKLSRRYTNVRSRTQRKPGGADKAHAEEADDVPDFSVDWDTGLPLSPRSRDARRLWYADMKKRPSAVTDPDVGRALLAKQKRDKDSATPGKRKKHVEQHSNDPFELVKSTSQVPVVRALLSPGKPHAATLAGSSPSKQSARTHSQPQRGGAEVANQLRDSILEDRLRPVEGLGDASAVSRMVARRHEVVVSPSPSSRSTLEIYRRYHSSQTGSQARGVGNQLQHTAVRANDGRSTRRAIMRDSSRVLRNRRGSLLIEASMREVEADKLDDSLHPTAGVQELVDTAVTDNKLSEARVPLTEEEELDVADLIFQDAGLPTRLRSEHTDKPGPIGASHAKEEASASTPSWERATVTRGASGDQYDRRVADRGSPALSSARHSAKRRSRSSRASNSRSSPRAQEEDDEVLSMLRGGSLSTFGAPHGTRGYSNTSKLAPPPRSRRPMAR